MSIEDKFNEDYNEYYRVMMSQQPLVKVERLRYEIKQKYNKTDEDMAIKLYERMREIELKYYPNVFKAREELWKR